MCVKDGLTTIKSGHQTTGSMGVIWSDESSFMLFTTSIKKGLHLENTQGSLQSGMPGSNSETWRRFCDGLGSNIVIQYSVGPITNLHGRITATEYMDRLGN
jgi:hypothetical protein